MSGWAPELGTLPVLAGIVLRYFLSGDTLDWIRRKPTDWNAVREQLGYDAAPDRPVRPAPIPRQRRFLGFWPLRTDWDRVRREYGYGVTLEGEYRVLPDRTVRRQ